MIILCAILLGVILEGVTTEAFNDTYHIAITVVLGVISYFLLRLIKEHDKDREKLDKVDTKLTRAVNDIGWIRRSLKRSSNFDLDDRDRNDNDDDEAEN